MSDSRGRTYQVYTETRFGVDLDGGPAAIEIAGGPQAWRYYTAAGDSVVVAARLDPRPGSGIVPVGSTVTVDPLPYYVGVAEFVRRVGPLVFAIHRSVRRADAVVLRVPGPISSLAALSCLAQRKSYSVDVVGDLGDILRCGVLGKLGATLRPVAEAHVRWVVRRAVAARYVTDEALQRRYPPGPGIAGVGVSDVCLGEEGLLERARAFPDGPPRLIAVGTLEAAYKGHDVLIDAVVALAEWGVDVSATIVGDGRLRPHYERLAQDHGVAERIRFTGKVPARAELNRLLDDATIFVMPSRQEGLPRAMVEAMARSLPVVGTRVGGIPELLEPSCLIEVDDARALARTVARLSTDREFWERQSARNLARAREFDEGDLQLRFTDWLGSIPRQRPSGAPAPVRRFPRRRSARLIR